MRTAIRNHDEIVFMTFSMIQRCLRGKPIFPKVAGRYHRPLRQAVIQITGTCDSGKPDDTRALRKGERNQAGLQNRGRHARDGTNVQWSNAQPRSYVPNRSAARALALAASSSRFLGGAVV